MTQPNDTTASSIMYPLIHSDSPIIRVSSTKRIGRIASIFPITTTQGQDDYNNSNDINNNTRTPVPFQVSSEIAGFLAMREFNLRSGRILPNLSQLIGNCDLQIDLLMYDSTDSPIVAATALTHAITIHNHSPETPRPMAITGSLRSAVSQPMAILSGTYGIPQISPGSTAHQLDNKGIFPYFGRTIPSNALDAYVLLQYLHSLQVEYFGLLYVRDQYGVEFSGDIQALANQQNKKQSNMVLSTFSYEPDNHNSLRNAVRQMAKTKFRYFFAILRRDDAPVLLKEAHKLGIAGTSNHVWLFSDAAFSLIDPTFSVADKEIHEAMDGIGIVNVNIPTHPAFTKAMTDFQFNTDLQQEYIQRHDDLDFFTSVFNLTTHETVASSEQQLYFDAVISLGLAACNVENRSVDFFSGPDLYSEWLTSDFIGVSGQVQFNTHTGSRDGPGLAYGIFNLVADPNMSKPGNFRFTSKLAVSIKTPELQLDDVMDEYTFGLADIQVISPFVYAQGSTIPPEQLPALDESMNLIHPGIIIVGLILSAFVMLSSLGWGCFTCIYNKRPSVKAAQPFFLLMNVVGTFIMGAAIVPTSLQYPVPQQGLDIACMAYPWLFAIGFNTSFSAIYCKSYRLNKLMKSAEKCQRVTVRPRDVLAPFFIIMALNLTVLLCWTLIDPLVSTRTYAPNVLDEFGRQVESVAICQSQNKMLNYIFHGLWLLIFFCAVVIANYETYKGRNQPSEFNDSKYIAISMGVLLEAMIVAFPVLFLVTDLPSTFYLIRAVFTTICATALSFPLLLHKYRTRNQKKLSDEKSRLVLNVSEKDGDNALPTSMMNDVTVVKEGLQAIVSSLNIADILDMDQSWNRKRTSGEEYKCENNEHSSASIDVGRRSATDGMATTAEGVEEATNVNNTDMICGN